MRYLSSQHPDWVELSVEGDDEAEGHRHRVDLQSSLRSLLVVEHLGILLGSGASLSIKNGDGNTPAPSMDELWDEAAAQAGDQLDDIIERVRYEHPNGRKDIEELLSRCQAYQQFERDGFVARFIENTEALIVDRCRFVSSETPLDHHESFLRRVARRPPRKARAQVFTTNYDTAIEEAASRLRFIPIDGFSHTTPQRFDGSHFDLDFVRRTKSEEVNPYVPNVFHLLKLHGSVDWEKEGRGAIRNPSTDSPIIIYPRSTKFEQSYDPPFFELMARFQSALRQPNTALIVVGFGFNDAHLTGPILHAVQSNISFRVLIVGPDLSTVGSQPIDRLAKLAQMGDSRIEMVEGTFGEFVPLLPDLVAETESERHVSRLDDLDS